MAIHVGDTLPSATFMTFGASGPEPITSDQLFKGKKVALFALPGAFTPTCSAKHLPGFKEHAAEFRAKGVDTIACVSVNDVFVMKAWGESQGVGDDVLDAGRRQRRLQPAPWVWRWTPASSAWALARSAIRCWSTTASSRKSTLKRAESSRSPPPNTCSLSCSRPSSLPFMGRDRRRSPSGWGTLSASADAWDDPTQPHPGRFASCPFP